MSKKQLLEMLPEHFAMLKEMQEIAKAEGKQFDNLHKSVDDLLDQMFITTATWGLSYWEKRYLMPVLSEDTDYEKRRRRILTKKRSNKANLIDILRAVEPSITLAWGRLVIPFTINKTIDYYDFGELISVLEVEKPSHLSYSFRLIPNGYTAKAYKNDRYSVALKLISGTSHSGRYPRANSLGVSLHNIFSVIDKEVTGVAEFQRTGGLVSGGKDTPTAFSGIQKSILNIATLSIKGVSSFNPSGKYKSGQILYEATGKSCDTALNLKFKPVTGESDLRSGQTNTESIGSVDTIKTAINSSFPTGIATPFRCGTRAASKEVA